MSTDREKLEELYGVFSEAAKTKGPYAHIQPKTCGDVADVLGRQIEGENTKQEESGWSYLSTAAGLRDYFMATPGRCSGKSEFLRLYKAWVENDETGR